MLRSFRTAHPSTACVHMRAILLLRAGRERTAWAIDRLITAAVYRVPMSYSIPLSTRNLCQRTYRDCLIERSTRPALYSLPLGIVVLSNRAFDTRRMSSLICFCVLPFFRFFQESLPISDAVVMVVWQLKCRSTVYREQRDDLSQIQRIVHGHKIS